MSDQCSATVKIHRALNGKSYPLIAKAICLPNGNRRYFKIERDVWVFLTGCDRIEMGRLAA
jgi:hypothetical protein